MKPKLLFFVTEDWFFCSHFIGRASAAKAAGYEVSVITHVGKHSDQIIAQGFQLYALNLNRKSMNPWSEMKTLSELFEILRRVKPDVMHNIALKPIIYGAFIAKLAGVRSVISAPVGLGYVYSSSDLLARLLRPWISFAFRYAFQLSRKVIFENPDDMTALGKGTMVNEGKAEIIRGAGVDLLRFRPAPEPEGIVSIILVGRMLRDKGIREFVEAARIIKNNGLSARFILVGDGDPGNPASIAPDLLRSWEQEKICEWWGRREDMPEVFANAHIVCLPSYREGLPKVLLEAAACGKAIVTTDVPGCREVVEQGVNGLLVPPRNPAALAEALCQLILSPSIRRSMGKAGRTKAEAEFSAEYVEQKTLKLYESIAQS